MSFMELKWTILSLTYPSLAISSLKSPKVMSRTGYPTGFRNKRTREREKDVGYLWGFPPAAQQSQDVPWDLQPYSVAPDERLQGMRVRRRGCGDFDGRGNDEQVCRMILEGELSVFFSKKFSPSK